MKYYYFILCFIADKVYDILPSRLFDVVNDLSKNNLLAYVYGSGLDWFCVPEGSNENEPF